jgi:hypothetical protein
MLLFPLSCSSQAPEVSGCFAAPLDSTGAFDFLPLAAPADEVTLLATPPPTPPLYPVAYIEQSGGRSTGARCSVRRTGFHGSWPPSAGHGSPLRCRLRTGRWEERLAPRGMK